MGYCFGVIVINKTYVNQIVVIQKRATRIVSILNWNEHPSPIFKKLGITPLEELFLFHLGSLVFLQYRCWSPAVTVDFIQNFDIHRYNPRYANLINVQYRITALVATSFLNSGPKYYDSGLCYLKEAQTALKCYIKHFISTF